MVKNNSEDYIISVVDNALKVLIGLRDKGGKSIRELANELNISKSTLYRILRTLELRNFVRQDADTQKYYLGIQMFELGVGLQERFDIRNISLKYMKQLRDETGETVQLAIVDEDSILILETVDGIRELRIFSNAGTRKHLTYGNFGKVFLSELSPDELQEIIKKYPLKKYAANSIVDVDTYLESLKYVKQKGIAIGIDDPIDGAYCLCVPIYNHNMKIVASIAISGAKTQDNMDNLQNTEDMLKDTARQISLEMGKIR